MNSQHFELLRELVNPNYALQAEQARNSRSSQITTLLSQRRLPDKGWDDASIRSFLEEIASFDTNNFMGNVGVGEREGRVISALVRERHFGLSHGIGRSGDVMAEQPKAAGSSVLVQLTRYLSLDAIRIAGIKAAKACCVLPAATGLSMTLVFLALRQMRPSGKYVVWSRIDQKSCFKAIGAAGLAAIVVELKPVEGTDALGTDVEGIRQAIEGVGAENVLCVVTTTSTFAPRVPDSIDEVAVLAKTLDVPHVINNAYGLQCSKCCHLIEQGCRTGRVDAFVQSTDKNFMVPVGGAIIAAPNPKLTDKVSEIYPGRASLSPLLDLFITLMGLGASGWKKLLDDRKANATWFQERLAKCAEKQGLHLLKVPANRISFALDLSPLAKSLEDKGQGDQDHLTFLGSALFTRRVSGPRVVLCATPSASSTAAAPPPLPPEAQGAAMNGAGGQLKVKGKYSKTVDGTMFHNYGAHTDSYACCYLTAACAIGAEKDDLEAFITRLESALQDYRKGAGRKDGKAKDKEKPSNGVSVEAKQAPRPNGAVLEAVAGR